MSKSISRRWRSCLNRKRQIRAFVEEYTLKDGRSLYLLGEGRLINLAAAEGHPASVMDMSFANQALCLEYLVQNRGKRKAAVYGVPDEIDKMIGRPEAESHGHQYRYADQRTAEIFKAGNQALITQLKSNTRSFE